MKKFICSIVFVFIVISAIALGIGLGFDYKKVDTVYINEVIQCLNKGESVEEIV